MWLLRWVIQCYTVGKSRGMGVFSRTQEPQWDWCVLKDPGVFSRTQEPQWVELL